MARRHFDLAVDVLRRAGFDDFLVRALLARAAFRRNQHDFLRASIDLEEAHEISRQGAMRLYLTDYHLESARLTLAQLSLAGAPKHAIRRIWQRIFGARTASTNGASRAVFQPDGVQTIRSQAERHYEAARQLIEDTGYKRRLPELEAVRACLDGEIPASILDPDHDHLGRPAAA
jgi:hypothetical protein